MLTSKLVDKLANRCCAFNATPLVVISPMPLICFTCVVKKWSPTLMMPTKKYLLVERSPSSINRAAFVFTKISLTSSAPFDLDSSLRAWCRNVSWSHSYFSVAKSSCFSHSTRAYVKWNEQRDFWKTKKYELNISLFMSFASFETAYYQYLNLLINWQLSMGVHVERTRQLSYFIPQKLLLLLALLIIASSLQRCQSRCVLQRLRILHRPNVYHTLQNS